MTSGEAVESRGLTRVLARWLVRRYYPNIEISNADRIPQTGPVLLCANHANSLLDPVLLGIVAVRPVRFLAKAPLFERPVMGPLMRALGMIPAFRGSDDSRQVRRNIESLDVGADVLAAGHALGIFPEGKSTDQVHLEMVRSGAARMAVRAEEKGAQGLTIVPIGITYQRKDQFRSSAWIQVGEPIDVTECIHRLGDDRRKAMRTLTKELDSRLREVVVHLDDPEWESWLDDLETLAPPAGKPTKTPRLRQRKRLADAMNYFLSNDRARAESVADEIQAYRAQVHAAGLTVDSPVLRMKGPMVFLTLAWNLLCQIVMKIPALAGTLHHLVPFVCVRAIASRLDQPGRKTVSSSRLMVGVPLYLLWYFVVAWWMFGYFASWFASLWLCVAPFAGLLALYYWRRVKQTALLMWHQVRVTIRRSTLERLRRQQSNLRRRLAKLAEEYARVSPRPQLDLRRSRKGLMVRTTATVLVSLLVAAAAWLATYWIFDDPLKGNGFDLKSFSTEEIQAYLGADEQALVHLIDGLNELEVAATKIQRSFAEGRRSYANQRDNDDVRELLRRYLAYRHALLRIIWKYQRYSVIADEKLRLRTFLLDFTAAAVLYEASLKFVDQFGQGRKAAAKLNEPEPHWDIPADMYDTIKRNLASPGNARAFNAARNYYRQDSVQERFNTHRLLDSQPYSSFHGAIAASEVTVGRIESLGGRIIKVAEADLEKLLRQVQYEIQSTVSTWIGDIKIRQPRAGKALISKEHLVKLRSRLQPGDILLERRNWYLSNAFLPGYWPHSAVYVGTVEDLRQRGLDQNEQVRKHWSAFAAKDRDGHEHVIIEAVSEGVIFSSLEHSVGEADSVAVLRPNVSEPAKNEAIARAFGYAGRPYDFEFDFETTHRLVCTELVFRAFGGNSGAIRFPLERIMGRMTMPAINLVEKFDREYGTENAQFELIAFIDGDEATGTSRYVTDVGEFRDTRHRPASTFLQGSTPYALKSIGPFGWVLISLTALCGVVVVGRNTARLLRART